MIKFLLYLSGYCTHAFECKYHDKWSAYCNEYRGNGCGAKRDWKTRNSKIMPKKAKGKT